MKNKIKKYIAIVSVIALIFATIPVYKVFVYADTTERKVVLHVTVKNPNGEKIVPSIDADGKQTGGASVTIESVTAQGNVKETQAYCLQML